MMAFYDFPRVKQTSATQLRVGFHQSCKDYCGSQKCKTLIKGSFDPLKDKRSVKRNQSDMYKISEAAQKHLDPYEGGLNLTFVQFQPFFNQPFRFYHDRPNQTGRQVTSMMIKDRF